MDIPVGENSDSGVSSSSGIGSSGSSHSSDSAQEEISSTDTSNHSSGSRSSSEYSLSTNPSPTPQIEAMYIDGGPHLPGAPWNPEQMYNNYLDFLTSRQVVALRNARMEAARIVGWGVGMPGMIPTNNARTGGMAPMPAAFGARPMGAGGGLGDVNGHAGQFLNGIPPQPNFPLGAGLGKYVLPGPLEFFRPQLDRMREEAYPQPSGERDQGLRQEIPGYALNLFPNALINAAVVDPIPENPSSGDDDDNEEESGNNSVGGGSQAIPAATIANDGASASSASGSGAIPGSGNAATPNNEAVANSTNEACATLNKKNTMSNVGAAANPDIGAATNPDIGAAANPNIGAAANTVMGAAAIASASRSSDRQQTSSSGNRDPKLNLNRCLLCDYVTNDLDILMSHIDTHYPVKTFVCVHCTQAFPGPAEFNEHNQPGKCPFRKW